MPAVKIRRMVSVRDALPAMHPGVNLAPQANQPIQHLLTPLKAQYHKYAVTSPRVEARCPDSNIREPYGRLLALRITVLRRVNQLLGEVCNFCSRAVRKGRNE